MLFIKEREQFEILIGVIYDLHEGLSLLFELDCKIDRIYVIVSDNSY